MSETRTPIVDFEVLLVGETTAPRAWIFRPEASSGLGRLQAMLFPGDRTLTMPLLAFVVSHPTAGKILVDTGLYPGAAENLRGDYGLLHGLFFRSLRAAPEDFERQLRGLELDPAQIELVIMTHLHVDHTSAMRLLPNARFACARTEWAAATERGALTNGYFSRHLPPQSRMRLLDFDRDGVSYESFQSTIDLLGDGSIRLLYTPGHTRGHLSVLLGIAGGEALLIGDAVYTMRSLHEEILPMRTVDDQLYLRSLRQLKAFVDDHPDAIVIPTHDEHAWRQKGPGRLEASA